jgi:hypothetical protein
MKNILILGFLILSINLMAQVPGVTKKVKTLSPSLASGLIANINNSLADTLKSGDTLFYKVVVTHDRVGFPYLSILKKVVATDTTADVTFWQSVDGTHNWLQVKNTTSPTAWSTTLAKSTLATEYDFWQNVAWFRSQYLGIRFIQRVKSGSKVIVYGSVRYDNY